MLTSKTVKKFHQIPTPFYYYDLNLLQKTLDALKAALPAGFKVHYALKANANHRILQQIRREGLGADCVSGNEVKLALETGFANQAIVFAGVGKADREIGLALKNDIHCFNCESLAEMEVINALAGQMEKTAPVALRINPDLDAHTHRYITTGKEENKFGISVPQLPGVLERLEELSHLRLIGIHFHIGSQIRDLGVFEQLCNKVNQLRRWLGDRGVRLEHLNLGGGLGVDYQQPDQHLVPDFAGYFGIFDRHLEREERQTVHFELGRALVAQCGILVCRVVYVKQGLQTRFAIVDAGMTELIRPALYQAYHRIENLSSSGSEQVYDVVGPVCESSDFFGKQVRLPETRRGDLIAIRTAGAYGEVMSSRYNLRDPAKVVYSDGKTD